MKVRLTAVVVAVIVTLVAAATAAAGDAGAVTIVEYTKGLNGYSLPGFIVDGSDGDMWFTDSNCDSSHPTCAIGRITPAGAITEYSGGTLQTGAIPDDITAGPGGNLWFTVQNPAAIGRITPAGAITEYTSSALPASSQPQGIALGPDGNLWVAVMNQDLDVPGTQGELARVTPTGALTAFTAGLNKNTEPQFIAAGPGHELWFTDSDEQTGTAAAIGRVTTAGQITESASGLPDGAEPERIGPGANGSLWFTDDYFHFLGQISAAGHVSDSPTTQGDAPDALAVAPDGSVWFTDCGEPPAIGRISPSGQVTYYTAGLPDASCPDDIIQGPDGNMWFTDDNGHGVGKVTLGLAPIVSAGGASGVSGSGAVVSAAVNPAGGAVSSVEFQYGRSTAYGSSVAATPRALGASGQPSSVSARLAGLPADTLIHYRAVATNPYGTTYGADHTFRTASAAAKPALGRVQETHSRWREAGGGSRKATPEGTTFSFTLSAPATVHFTLTRRRRVSSFSVAGHSGRNTVRFAGRVSHHRLLAPGRYVVLVQADNPGGRSPVRRLSFTILRG